MLHSNNLIVIPHPTCLATRAEGLAIPEVAGVDGGSIDRRLKVGVVELVVYRDVAKESVSFCSHELWSAVLIEVGAICLWIRFGVGIFCTVVTLLDPFNLNADILGSKDTMLLLKRFSEPRGHDRRCSHFCCYCQNLLMFLGNQFFCWVQMCST